MFHLKNQMDGCNAMLNSEDGCIKEGQEFPGGTVVKNLPDNAGNMVSIPGPEYST